MEAFKKTLIIAAGTSLIVAASAASGLALSTTLVNQDSAFGPGSAHVSRVSAPVTSSPHALTSGACAVASGTSTSPGSDGPADSSEDLSQYSPLGFTKINGGRFAVYGLRNGAKLDDLPGPGQGFADVFDCAGHLIRRFTVSENLNSPPQIIEYISVEYVSVPTR